MKVTWENTDIVAGQRVGAVGRAEQWIIGYEPITGKKALISLEDGMIAKIGDNQEIAEMLNLNNDAPMELLQRPFQR